MTTSTRKPRNSGASATLASMAAKPAEAAPAASTAPAATTAPATPAASATVAIDWNTFPAATVATYTRNEAPKVDREATTPEFIKAQVAAAFAATEAAGNPKRPLWFEIPFGSVTVEEEFLKVGKRYATFKGWTMRGIPNTKVPGTARFCVKPKEERKKAPVAAVAAA